MAGKSFMLRNEVDPEQAYNYLKNNIRSTKVTNITYDSNMKRIDLEGNYYTYQVSFIGNQMTITMKMVQKWMIIMIALAITVIFTLVTGIGIVIFIVLMNSESKEIYDMIHQLMNVMPEPEKVESKQ